MKHLHHLFLMLIYNMLCKLSYLKFINNILSIYIILNYKSFTVHVTIFNKVILTYLNS